MEYKDGSNIKKSIKNLIKCSSKEFENAIPNLNINDIPLIVNILEKHPERLEKLLASLKESESLEVVGKALSTVQIKYLLDTVLKSESKDHWKLTPILVGLPHSIFFQLVLFASDKQISELKHEAMTESVGHHLTTLCHEMNNQFTNITSSAENFEKELINLDINMLNKEKLTEILKRIEETSNYFENLYNSANRSLEIAWNSDRSDLIETLNHVKDGCQKYSMILVGAPRTDEEEPTGLYAKLEERFSQVFGRPNDQEDVEALLDSEPAYEGLVKFRIWYLSDLKHVGLLPDVHEKDLDKKEPFYRQKLFLVAKSNLEKSGLKTVADLKKALIFSKESLKAYIENHLT